MGSFSQAGKFSESVATILMEREVQSNFQEFQVSETFVNLFFFFFYGLVYKVLFQLSFYAQKLVEKTHNENKTKFEFLNYVKWTRDLCSFG